MFSLCCHNPVDEPSNDPSKVAGVKFVSPQSRVEGGVGTVNKFETLVVGQSELWDGVAMLMMVSCATVFISERRVSGSRWIFARERGRL
jgi:hypothetical protein